MKIFPGQKGLSLFLSHVFKSEGIYKSHGTLSVHPKKKNK